MYIAVTFLKYNRGECENLPKKGSPSGVRPRIKTMARSFVKRYTKTM